MVQTNGQENVSVEYSTADLALLVKEKQAAGWQFVFLGAGLDAFEAADAAGLHLPEERFLAYARGKSKKTFDVMAAKLGRFGVAREASALDFTLEERKETGEDSEEAWPSAGSKSRPPSSVEDIGL